MSMSTSVDILVPSAAAAQAVRKDVGNPRAARFVTDAGSRAKPDLLITPFEDLDSNDVRERWGALVARWAASTPIVFMWRSFGSGKTADASVLALALQELAHWSRVAGREPYVALEPGSLRRMILARQHDAEAKLIASASVHDGRLVVWSCEPRRFDVAIADIPPLAAMSQEALAGLRVSASGSRIHWDAGDVDIDLDTIRECTDARVRRAHEAERRTDASRYAQAIRALRLERGLKQSDIPGLSERQVRRLEAGGTVPHIGTLRKLAEAHGMAVDGYLGELATRTAAGPSPSSPRRASKRGKHASVSRRAKLAKVR